MKSRLRSIDAARERRLKALGAGYSSFVKIARFALPLLALVIVGVILSTLSESPVQQQIAALPKEDQTTPGESAIVNAKYEGIDDQGRKYTLIAAAAERKDEQPDMIALEKPKADIALKDAGWLAVHANEGVFNSKAGTLDLAGDVTVFHDAGYELTTQGMHIALTAKSVTSDLPVKGQGPRGDIAARNMSITEGGNKIIFGGPATLLLRLNARERG